MESKQTFYDIDSLLIFPSIWNDYNISEELECHKIF